MKIRFDKKYFAWGLTALVVIMVSLGMVFMIFKYSSLANGINRFYVIMRPVTYGIIIAYLLAPILNFVEYFICKYICRKSKREMGPKQAKLVRAFALVCTYLIAFAVVAAFLFAVLPDVFRSIRNIINLLPFYTRNLNRLVVKALSKYPEIEAFIDSIYDDIYPKISEWFYGTAIPSINDAIVAISGYAVSTVVVIWNLIIGLIISIYLVGGKEKFGGQAKKILYSLMDVKNANSFISDCRSANKTFSGFISGKLFDSLIIGILCYFGTKIIGTPYPLLISVIIGVTNIIPFFGPYLGAIPSVLLILVIRPIHALYFLIFILILQQFDGNVLGPKILGDSTGLSGFWVIFSITLFGGLFGVPGMIVGVPCFAVLYSLSKRHINRSLKKRNLPIETEKYQILRRIDPVNQEFVNFTEVEITKQHKLRDFVNKITNNNKKAPANELAEENPENTPEVNNTKDEK